jgi:hypothetical protein
MIINNCTSFSNILRASVEMLEQPVTNEKKILTRCLAPSEYDNYQRQNSLFPL